jgi:hypothetical protein
MTKLPQPFLILEYPVKGFIWPGPAIPLHVMAKLSQHSRFLNLGFSGLYGGGLLFLCILWISSQQHSLKICAWKVLPGSPDNISML